MINIKTDTLPELTIGHAIIAHEIYGESCECGDGRIINITHVEMFPNKTEIVNHLISAEYDARITQM